MKINGLRSQFRPAYYESNQNPPVTVSASAPSFSISTVMKDFIPTTTVKPTSSIFTC